MEERKRIGLVAHDACKAAMVAWTMRHEAALSRHELFATGTTGRLITEACPSLSVAAKKSGPLGGDQQIGAMIAEDGLDVLFFFIDPMSSQPHDVDVKALTRLAVVYDIVLALDVATADFVIGSPLFAGGYAQSRRDYADYLKRPVG
jgi:methylglyoxal synthase